MNLFQLGSREPPRTADRRSRTQTHTQETERTTGQIIFVSPSPPPPEQSMASLSLLNKHVCVQEPARK